MTCGAPLNLAATEAVDNRLGMTDESQKALQTAFLAAELQEQNPCSRHGLGRLSTKSLCPLAVIACSTLIANQHNGDAVGGDCEVFWLFKHRLTHFVIWACLPSGTDYCQNPPTTNIRCSVMRELWRLLSSGKIIYCIACQSLRVGLLDC